MHERRYPRPRHRLHCCLRRRLPRLRRTHRHRRHPPSRNARRSKPTFPVKHGFETGRILVPRILVCGYCATWISGKAPSSPKCSILLERRRASGRVAWVYAWWRRRWIKTILCWIKKMALCNYVNEPFNWGVKGFIKRKSHCCCCMYIGSSFEKARA